MWLSTLLALAAQGPPLEALLPGATGRLDAIAAAGESGDDRYLPPLIDLLAFAQTADEWYALLDALGALLSEDLREVERPWRTLRLRLGSSVAGARSYPDFKRALLSARVDSRYDDLLAPSPGSELPMELVDWGGVSVDGIPALVDPPTIDGVDADYLEDGEPVFGLVIDGLARAYPLRILDWHEMANDRLGGVSFALSYCTLCGAGIAYRTGGAEERDLFRTSGLLLESNKLMFDERTGSLWSQVEGRPLHGDRVGQEGLEVLPVDLLPWSVWLERHPQTTVLDIETGHQRDYRLGSAYGEYFGRPDTMFPARGVPALGDRAKERMLVIREADRTSVVAAAEALRAGVLLLEGPSSPILVLAEPRPEFDVPAAWRSVAPELATWRTLEYEALEEALTAEPERAEALTLELLLELPTHTRLRLLEASTRSLRWTLPASVRLRASQFGLARDIRAYRAPDADLRWRAGSLEDPSGGRWQAEHDALVGPTGQRFERLPSHLAFRFGVGPLTR